MLNENEAIYKVETEAFEGPFELLLRLIEERKLHINDISLAKIADDYIAHLRKLEKFPLKNSANFILIASILMLIKSKSLLPALDLTIEEEQNIDELEKRLKEYQRMRMLSKHIKSRFGARFSFFREQNKNIERVFSPDKNTKIPALLFSINNILRRLPKKILMPKVTIEKVISLEKMIENLMGRVKQSLKTSFKNFSGLRNSHGNFTRKEKINVIISFLAMLELVKREAIAAKQDCQFGDINIQTQNIETPNYN